VVIQGGGGTWWNDGVGHWLAALLLALCLVASGGAVAAPEAPDLVVYVRDSCPHCDRAKDFLRELQAEQPQLRIELRPVDRQPEFATELSELSWAAGAWPPGVPSFLAGGVLLVGFDDQGMRASEIRALLGMPTTSPEQAPGAEPAEWLDAERLGLPVFTLAMGLLDGFNPCAMWVLLFLLSLLVRLRDQHRMALVAGTFVLVSGLVYYAFMAAWLNLFLMVGFGTPVRVTLAVVALVFATLNLKDGIVGLRGPSLSIPQAAKPGIHARVRALLVPQGLAASLLSVTLLALLVNTVELLCTAGLPAIYTATLTQQVEAPSLRYAYLGLYILGYMADDSLMVVIAVTALSSRKLDERGGRWLKALSGVVMLALGLVLLFRPSWLA